ncbi:hypothetical protein PtrSN001A_012136, partial [Pyrenophora tritici-repentis]
FIATGDTSKRVISLQSSNAGSSTSSAQLEQVQVKAGNEYTITLTPWRTTLENHRSYDFDESSTELFHFYLPGEMRILCAHGKEP